MTLRESNLEGYVLLSGRKLPACAGCLVIDRLFWMDDTRPRILGSDGTQVSASGGHGGSSSDDAFTPYSDDNHSDYWKFADVPVDFEADTCTGVHH